MLVLKKDALVKLLGDELYGIELENEMLQDLENRANERREILDIVGNLCDAYGYNRREVQAKLGSRSCSLARTERTIGTLMPISS